MITDLDRLSRFISGVYWANASLRGGLSDLPSRKGKKLYVPISPDDIPRKTSIEEKLGTILPEVLGVESPKGTKAWQNFKRLKEARDSTIHLKNQDVHYSALEDEKCFSPLFSTFFRDDIVEFPGYALDMIVHFGPPKIGGQWFDLAKKRLDLALK